MTKEFRIHHRIERRTLLGGVGAAGVALAAPRIGRTQQRVIRYWTWLDPRDNNPRSRVQQASIERFQSATGNQVEVELVDWRTIHQQLIRAVAANEAPDLVRVYSAAVPEQVAANTLLPLDDFLGAWQAAKRDDIGPPLQRYNGRVVAMYVENRYYLLYARQDFLREAGLEAPRTFEAVAQAAMRLRNDRRSALIWPASQRSTDTYSYASSMIWAMGGDIVGEDKRALFNQEGGVRFYTWLRDLIREQRAMDPSLISWDEDQVQQALNSSTCAMAFAGTNRVVATRRAIGAAGSGLVTLPPPSRDGNPPPVVVAGWSLAIPRTARNREGGWALLDGMTDTQSQIANAREAGEMPVRKSALQDPWFQSPDAAEMRGWIEYAARHARDTPSQKLVNARELNNLLNTATQEIVLRNRPVKEALDEAASRWNTAAA